MYGGVEIQLHHFLTSTLDGSEWQASRPGHFTPDTNFLGDWVGHGANLSVMEKRIPLSSAGNRTPIPRSTSL
jgi:hypothetical protein